MYLVALFKNNEGDCFVLAEKTEDIRDYSPSTLQGYKLSQFIITNNRTIALKTRLKFRIEELKSLKEGVDYMGYDESLISQIGLLTSRLLRRGVDVTDEIALQCYDIREGMRRMKQMVQK